MCRGNGTPRDDQPYLLEARHILAEKGDPTFHQLSPLLLGLTQHAHHARHLIAFDHQCFFRSRLRNFFTQSADPEKKAFRESDRKNGTQVWSQIPARGRQFPSDSNTSATSPQRPNRLTTPVKLAIYASPVASTATRACADRPSLKRSVTQRSANSSDSTVAPNTKSIPRLETDRAHFFRIDYRIVRLDPRHLPSISKQGATLNEPVAQSTKDTTNDQSHTIMVHIAKIIRLVLGHS